MRGRHMGFFVDASHGFELVAASGGAVSYDTHVHVSSWVIGLVHIGNMCLTKNGRPIRLNAGDGFVLQPYEAHALTAESEYALITLCLPKIVFEKSGTATEPAIADFLERVRDALALDRSVVSRLMRSVPRSPFAPPRDWERDGLWRVKTMLEERPEDDLDLDAMAAIACLGRFHVIRKFQRRYGLTPKRFQVLNRLRKARRACLGRTSLTQAALLAGFYDQSHFIREFRRLAAMTPRQYRDAVRHV